MVVRAGRSLFFSMQISEYLLEIENSNDVSTRTKKKCHPFGTHSVMHIITNHIYVFIVER